MVDGCTVDASTPTDPTDDAASPPDPANSLDAASPSDPANPLDAGADTAVGLSAGGHGLHERADVQSRAPVGVPPVRSPGSP